jgi:hypothetical protein
MTRILKETPIYHSIEDVPVDHLKREWISVRETICYEDQYLTVAELKDVLNKHLPDSRVEIDMDYNDYYPHCNGLQVTGKVLESEEQFAERVEKYRKAQFKKYQDPAKKKTETARKRAEAQARKIAAAEAAEKEYYLKLKEKWEGKV